MWGLTNKSRRTQNTKDKSFFFPKFSSYLLMCHHDDILNYGWLFFLLQLKRGNGQNAVLCAEWVWMARCFSGQKSARVTLPDFFVRRRSTVRRASAGIWLTTSTTQAASTSSARNPQRCSTYWMRSASESAVTLGFDSVWQLKAVNAYTMLKCSKVQLSNAGNSSLAWM